jgi:hypothetical protein
VLDAALQLALVRVLHDAAHPGSLQPAGWARQGDKHNRVSMKGSASAATVAAAWAALLLAGTASCGKTTTQEAVPN